MSKKTITSVDVAGKRVLIRVDFNVPMDDGKITDDRRIRAAIPTIRSVIERGGRAILMSHLGRPKGTGYEQDLSLEPVSVRLSELLGQPVVFPSHDCTDCEAEQAVAHTHPGDVLLLENLRFHKEEKAGDAGFASRLASFGDVYVNDAFGTCHRSDASMVALPKAMPADAPRVSGLLVEKEIAYLSGALANPARPYVVVLGGAKVSDKIETIEHLLSKADEVLIGGAMAYTLLKATGCEVGTSRVELDCLDEAKKIIDTAAREDVELHLPFDHICSTEFAEKAGDIEVFEDCIKPGFMGLDIGPKTQHRFSEIIKKAKTIVWNGPMGVFEWAPFKVGTKHIAEAIADATAAGATSIVGGGDSAAALEAFGLSDAVSHVSTGGGASLEMLSGKTLPALTVLDDA
jgi:phosphoglycerate kinase